MIALSKSLISPTHSYGKTMRRIPELAGMLPRLTDRHQQLVSSHGDTIDSREAPIIKAQGKADARHDGSYRVLHYGLETHIHQALLEEDTARAARLEEIRTELIPDGLKVVSFSYRAEAGQVEILAERLTPEILGVLVEIPIQKSNLAVVANDIITAGRELGELEEQRSALRETTRDITPGVARIEWAQVMGLIAQILEMNSGDAGAHEILTRMYDIDRKAARRVQSGTPEGDGDDEPGDDEPGDDEPGDDEPGDDEPADDEPADDEPADDDGPAADEPAGDEP